MSEWLRLSANIPIVWKNICSMGNRWHHNIGDELILIGLMKLITTNSDFLTNDARLWISWWDLSFLHEFHKYFLDQDALQRVSYLQEVPHGLRSGLRFLFLSYKDFFRYLTCDTFVVWGGELFTEETPGSYLYRFRSLLPFWIRKIFFTDTKLYIMWWVQKPKSWYNKRILKLIVKCANGWLLRDEDSIVVVKELQGIDTQNTELRPVSWFMDTSYYALDFHKIWVEPPPERVIWWSWLSDIKQNADAFEPCIVINTNPLSLEWTEKLRELLQQYYTLAYDIYFLPAFFTSNPQQNDLLCYNLLKKEFPGLKLLDWRDWEQFLTIFLSAQKVFCSRLHIYLLSVFLGLDVEAYPYQKKLQKMQALLSKLGMNN